MPVHRLARVFLVAAAACAPAVLGGCDPGTAEVSGTITLNGQPPKLKGLQITFVSTDGRPASAVVAEDGTFKAAAVPVGDAVGVAFVCMPIPASGPAPAATGRGKTPMPGGGPPIITPPVQAPYNPIPQMLRDASTSRLTTKVEAGKKNVYNYDIKR